jgi:hypothetical protein
MIEPTAQDSARYVISRINRAIDIEDWEAIRPLLKHLAYLAFFAAIAKERGRGIMTIKWRSDGN